MSTLPANWHVHECRACEKVWACTTVQCMGINMLDHTECYVAVNLPWTQVIEATNA